MFGAPEVRSSSAIVQNRPNHGPHCVQSVFRGIPAPYEPCTPELMGDVKGDASFLSKVGCPAPGRVKGYPQILATRYNIDSTIIEIPLGRAFFGVEC